MKKILIIIIILGCFIFTKGVYGKAEYNDGFNIAIYIDKDTCVEYFVSDGSYNRGTVFPRYNADGTLKTNKKCMKNR